MILDNFVVFNKSSMRIKFTENETNETITFSPASHSTLINYDLKEWFGESNVFTIYGPFMVLLRELAKYKRSW